MSLTIAPWTNHVASWAPSHQFIKILKLWYPFISSKGYSNSEGYIIGHNHAIGGKNGFEITSQEAHKFLIDDLLKVQNCMIDTIKMEITEGQYMAVMSWIFDLGQTEWITNKFGSIMLRGAMRECVYLMNSYKRRNGSIDLERSIRRSQELEWWNLS